MSGFRNTYEYLRNDADISVNTEVLKANAGGLMANLETLSALLDRVEKSVYILQERLEPILMNQDMVHNADDPTVPSGKSPTTIGLASMQARLINIDRKLNNICADLDL